MVDPHGIESRLRLTRQALSPSDEHRQRVRSALAARLAAQGPTPPLARGADAGRRLVSARLSRAVEAAVLVAAGFALGYRFAETRQPRIAEPAAGAVAADRGRMDAAAPAATPTLSPERAGSSAALAEPATERTQGSDAATSSTSAASSDASKEHGRLAKSPSSRAHRRVGSRAAPRATAADGFAEELALLRRAERATRLGDAVLARSLVADLDARFPKTALRQERAALLVLVTCASGEPGAQAAARDFMQQNEQSVYRDRIRAACSLEGAGGAGRQAPGADATSK